MTERNLLEEALTSSQLEGAVVTRSEARGMIREGRAPSSKHENHIKRKQEEVAQLKRHLAPGSGFKHRQLALLRHALMHPHATDTAASHQASHGIATQTATTDLNFLVSNGHLTKAKAGKAFLFTPSADLSHRLGLSP